jgi:hypothetical protein
LQRATVPSSQRRYLALIAVFGGASLAILAFLAFRPSDRISYELPELSSFEREEVTAIKIDRSGGSFALRQEGDEWLVSPGDYLADPSTVNTLLSALTEFAVTDVVSVSDDPVRYDLGEGGRVRVTAEGERRTLLALDVGRHAATFGHTFVRIPGDGRILQAGGELRDLFDRALDDFREKTVLTFDPATVSEITVTRDLPPEQPRTVRVVRADLGWERVAGDEAKDTGLDDIDPAGIEAALRFLGDLSAYRFRYTDDPLGNPWLSVTLEGEETYTLRLYPEQASVYPARSSASAFYFDMFLFQASLILEPFGLE